MNSKRRNLEVSCRNRSLQLGVLQKRVLSRPHSETIAVFGNISSQSMVFRHPSSDFGGVGKELDPTSTVITEQLSEGGLVFQEPASIQGIKSHSNPILVEEVERPVVAKQSTLRAKMACTLSIK